ncbi:MAG TPA: hypothetical protein DCS29_02370 [Candidatus Magasanikbacteria bacterium]|nr:MAG: hypothetical protein A2479_02110 [Candidatus Magasanikbacteria bacterium RIFOXYC2_FULL_39_8]HAT03601.1 hypothetical protein [Candidatus Magasanikbacteria bacterium]
MNKKILTIAQNKFNKFSKEYNNFINIIIDDWRGFRFIFDTDDVRKCNNDCPNCPLYNLVKDERKKNNFSAGLYKASNEDKVLFGPQNFLNCKTLEQYKNCFIEFLLQKAKTQKKIEEELDLIFNVEFIYTKNKNPKQTKEKFREDIIQKVLEKMEDPRKKIILNYIQK